jgi:hypothetical protein
VKKWVKNIAPYIQKASAKIEEFANTSTEARQLVDKLSLVSESWLTIGWAKLIEMTSKIIPPSALIQSQEAIKNQIKNRASKWMRDKLEESWKKEAKEIATFSKDERPASIEEAAKINSDWTIELDTKEQMWVNAVYELVDAWKIRKDMKKTVQREVIDKEIVSVNRELWKELKGIELDKDMINSYNVVLAKELLWDNDEAKVLASKITTLSVGDTVWGIDWTFIADQVKLSPELRDKFVSKYDQNLRNATLSKIPDIDKRNKVSDLYNKKDWLLQARDVVLDRISKDPKSFYDAFQRQKTEFLTSGVGAVWAALSFAWLPTLVPALIWVGWYWTGKWIKKLYDVYNRPVKSWTADQIDFVQENITKLWELLKTNPNKEVEMFKKDLEDKLP